MRQQITSFVWFFVALAAVLYAWAFLSAGYWTLKGEPQSMPAFLMQVITVIGGVLATNLGAVVGLRVGAPDSLRVDKSQAWYVKAGKRFQTAAAWFYVVILVLALIVWGLTGFSEDKVVSCIPDLAETLFGVAAGAVAAALGVSQ
jgi:hypothetical protein